MEYKVGHRGGDISLMSQEDDIEGKKKRIFVTSYRAKEKTVPVLTS